LLINAAKWAERYQPKAWQALLRQADDETIVERLRRATRTGRPLATDSVLAKLETKLNRRLRALPRGRPRTASDVDGEKREKTGKRASGGRPRRK